MAGKSAILTVKILSDASGAGKGIDQASSKFGKFQSGLSKMTPYAAAAAGGIALFGKQAVDSASRTQQAMGAIDSVFGKNATQVKQWASTSASSVGLAESQYGELASTMGAQLQNMGVSQKKAATSTNDMITLGADLAATFGGSTADAVGALSAALRGEADPAERYGLSLSQTAVNAELAKKGMDKLTGQALQTAKAQTILELATKQSGGAVGQFARESDTASGSAQIAAAQWENAKSALGESLLPAVTAVTTKLADMASWMSQNASTVTIVGAAVGGLAAAVLTLNVALKAYRATAVAVAAVQKVMQAAALGTRIQLAALAVQQTVTAAATKVAAVAQRVFNAAMRANPIGLVITAVMALIAVFVLLWNKNAAFRNFFIAAWNGIKAAAAAVWKAIKAVVSVVIRAITIYVKAYATVVKLVWKAIKTAAVVVWNAIKAVIKTVANWIKSVMRGVQSVVNAIWKGIKSAATSAWKGIRSSIQTVVNWIKSAMRGVKSVVNAIWTGIKTAARTAWSGIRTIISGVTNWIKSTIRGVKTVVNGVWSAIKSAATTAFNPIKTIIDGVKSAIEKVIGAARTLIDWLGRIKMPSISWPKPPAWLDKINPFNATYNPPAPATAAAGPALFTAGRLAGPRAAATTGGGGVIQINIAGGLSSSSDIARSVRRVLRDDSRRRGGVIIDRQRREVRS